MPRAMLTITNAELLKRIYNAFDPTRPLSADDDAYAERLIERIRDDLPRKAAAHLLLPGPADGLFERVTTLAESVHPDILSAPLTEISLDG